MSTNRQGGVAAVDTDLWQASVTDGFVENAIELLPCKGLPSS